MCFPRATQRESGIECTIAPHCQIVNNLLDNNLSKSIPFSVWRLPSENTRLAKGKSRYRDRQESNESRNGRIFCTQRHGGVPVPWPLFS
jgi:hypothetical protein